MENLVSIELVKCDRINCFNCVPVDEAKWDHNLDLAYCSDECYKSDQELREALEPLQTTHKRIDGVFNHSVCCLVPLTEWGMCSKCGKWGI
jgi:hypothetical protein